MKFAYLVHPLSQQSRLFVPSDENGPPRVRWGNDLLEKGGLMQHRSAESTSAENETPCVRIVDELRDLVSATGARTEGRVFEIPLGAVEILEDPPLAASDIEQAIEMATQWGAGIVGLGSLTGI